MKIVALFTTLFYLTNAHSIVGGEEVKSIVDYPFIVKLNNSCAGTIINKRWILTAAHCRPGLSHAVAGTLKSTDIDKAAVDSEGLQYLHFVDAVIHSKSKRLESKVIGILDYDFLLLRTKETIRIKEGTNINEIKIANITDPNLTNSLFTVLGWGDTEENARDLETNLRFLDLPLVNIQQANSEESYNGVINPESMLTLGYKEGKKDACNGDSGGPLIREDENGVARLHGVVSGGKGCARPNMYGIYANVAKVKDWIEKVISKSQIQCQSNYGALTVFFGNESRTANIEISGEKIEVFHLEKENSKSKSFKNISGDTFKYDFNSNELVIKIKNKKITCSNVTNYNPQL